jgi:hypothetical protein
VTEARILTGTAMEQPLRLIRVSSSNAPGVVVISETVSLSPALQGKTVTLELMCVVDEVKSSWKSNCPLHGTPIFGSDALGRTRTIQLPLTCPAGLD